MSQRTIYPPPRQWPSRMRRSLASQYLNEVHCVKLAPVTLAKLASIGGGPKFWKDGKFPLYAVEHLDEFAAARLGRLRASTSDTVEVHERRLKAAVGKQRQNIAGQFKA